MGAHLKQTIELFVHCGMLFFSNSVLFFFIVVPNLETTFWDVLSQKNKNKTILIVGKRLLILNMGLINKVDMVCLSPVGYVV